MQPDAIRYYYKKLSPAYQDVYEQILNGFLSHKTNISITEHVPTNDLIMVSEYVLRDYPGLYYVVNSRNTIHQGSPIIFRANYIYTPFITKGIQGKIDVKVNGLLCSAIQSGMDTTDKERAIYTYLTQNTRYSQSNDDNDQNNHSIIGPLLDGAAVCDGYAKAFKYLCDAIRIPCIVVYGKASLPNGGEEPHAWNIVKVKSACYHVDATWDSLHGDASSFDYFNLSDAEIIIDHTWDSNLMPACEVAIAAVTCVKGKKEFERYVLEQVSNGKLSFSVRFSKQFNDESEIMKMVKTFLKSAPLSVRLRLSNIQVRYNKTQSKAAIRLW